MSTRADFYLGRGSEAEWLGSIAFDGYPDGDGPQAVIFAGKPEDFRSDVARILSERDDATVPEDGWPWPWNDSKTTDYSYAFDGGHVWASCFGGVWFDPRLPEPEDSNTKKENTSFPDMSGRKNVAWDNRSGLIVVTSQEVIG